MWLAGLRQWGKRFDHAGAVVMWKAGTAQSKIDAFREAGVAVAEKPSIVGVVAWVGKGLVFGLRDVLFWCWMQKVYLTGYYLTLRLKNRLTLKCRYLTL
jgi:hypothetical protein